MSIFEPINKTIVPVPFSYRDALKKSLSTGLSKETCKSSVECPMCPINSIRSSYSIRSVFSNKFIQRSRSSSEDELVDTEASVTIHSTSDDSDMTSPTVKTSACSSDSEINVSTLISSESDERGEQSKSDSSDPDSPLLNYGENREIYNLERELYNKEVSKKKKQVEETDFLNPNWKLPGGKKYQKDGARLETAFYNGLPKWIKKYFSVNVKPRHDNGNVVVEFDMIYTSDSSKRIISFEIKGVNPNTINNLERQRKLISQGTRQKKWLSENYSDYKVDTIYCFVTGKIKTTEIIEESQTNSDWKSVTIVRNKPNLDTEFIKKIKDNGICVAIGETPQQCAKNALSILNLLK